MDNSSSNSPVDTRKIEYLKFLRQGLGKNSQCLLCGETFVPRDVMVLQEDGDMMLAHMRCSNCHGAYLSLVNFSPMGIAAMNTVTDLQQSEVQRFLDKQALQVDDVLAAYESLTKS